MKQPNLNSTLIAGLVGALLLALVVTLFDTSNTKQSLYAFFGFLVGAGTQIGVRLAGVS